MLNKNRREARNEADRMHLENLQKRLQRRIEVAREKGDENLMRMLEAESSYLK